MNLREGLFRRLFPKIDFEISNFNLENKLSSLQIAHCLEYLLSLIG